MYFNAPISHRPCPPSPKNDFNSSRPPLRVYNPNSSSKNLTLNSSHNSFTEYDSDESPISSPQIHFTVEKMTLSISPRSPRYQTSQNQNDLFNHAYYKRHKSSSLLDESGSNPYFPVQPLTDDKIDQIKAILKMNFMENADSPKERSFEMSVVDDKEIDNLLTRIENHVQALAPKYFQSSASLIPSTPSSSSNSFSSSYRITSKGSQLPSPRSPRRTSNELTTSNHSFSGFHSLQSNSDFKQKKKLRISRSPSADIERYHIIDKNGNDEIDRRIIELKGKLSKIAELIQSRNSNS